MTHTEEETERLNRYLSRAGVGSRRRADQLIAAGRVRLNGTVVEQLATQVRPGRDVVVLDGKVMTPPASSDIWIVLNKPAGSLTTRRDVRGRPTIFDHLPEKWRSLIPVGRLDLDTGGAILLTSNGFDANRLMHPRYQIDRIYEASVDGSPAPSELHALSRGIDLGDPTPARAEAR
ncbi:MAG TPA: S4 domain-containing protein, partial [Acidobacteriota bacterium]|nr:S4 domain-containing protein [Acidobacteriota bacterium]